MSRWIVAVFLLTASVCLAQPKLPSDAWLMQNYHFVPAPRPDEIRQVPPAVAQLQEIQNTLLNILRKADFDGDYESALAAAYEASMTAQQIAAMTGQIPRMGDIRPPQPPQPQPQRESAHYLIAFKDSTVKQATAVWRDSFMLHYTTPQGAHEQVRLDLVDWPLSAHLNPQGSQPWLQIDHRVAQADPPVTAAP